MDTYNNTKEGEIVSSAEADELKRMKDKTTDRIFSAMYPKLKVGSEEYESKRYAIGQGVWAIFRRKVVLDNSYKRTPRRKFKQGKEYIEGLTVADYRAYLEKRHEDIRPFYFQMERDENRLKVEDVLDLGEMISKDLKVQRRW